MRFWIRGQKITFCPRTSAWKLAGAPIRRPKRAVSVDGYRVAVHGQYDVEIVATDSSGESRLTAVDYTATDIRQYDAVLGALYAVNPDCSFRDRAWRYRSKDGDGIEVKKVDFKEMLTDVGDTPIFAVCGTPAEHPRFSYDEDEPEGPPVFDIYTVSVEELLPPEYTDYADVFSEEDAAAFPQSTRAKHTTSTTGGAEVPYRPTHPWSQGELVVLRKYIDEYMARGWIHPSESPAGAPILLIDKKDGGLRLCMDNQGLNKITVKDRHPLPLINETLDRPSDAAIYTKLDLQGAYYKTCIKEDDEWKTAFRTRYGHFEHTVIPFGLANASATVQAYINEALKPFLDHICMTSLDLVILSRTVEEHAKHVRKVLDYLRMSDPFVKISKCALGQGSRILEVYRQR